MSGEAARRETRETRAAAREEKRACQHFSFHAIKSLDRESPFSLALRVVSLLSCLSRLAPLVTRVVFAVSGVLLDGLRNKRDCSWSSPEGVWLSTCRKSAELFFVDFGARIQKKLFNSPQEPQLRHLVAYS